MPVLRAETHEEAGQGEDEGAGGEESGAGQLLIQHVGHDGQEHRGEDEHLDEGWTSENLKIVIDDEFELCRQVLYT